MAQVTVYCVQPYVRRGRDVLKGDLRQFRSETTARNAAAVASHQAAGVVVYVIAGSPEFDAWSEPRLVTTFGDIPRGAAASPAS